MAFDMYASLLIFLLYSLLIYDSMADLGFGADTRLQDGTGDRRYMEYIHKYMRVIVVTIL